MKVRCIISSKQSGEKENVFFTDDFNEPVEDFIVPGYELDSDDIIEADLPSGFPLNYTLHRE